MPYYASVLVILTYHDEYVDYICKTQNSNRNIHAYLDVHKTVNRSELWRSFVMIC